MTPAERVRIALARGIPDRVPLLLASSTLPAREVGLSLPDYFADPEAMAEGQFRFSHRFGSDVLVAYEPVAREAEAFGAGSVYREGGPPNVGAPVLRSPEEARRLARPDPASSAPLQHILRCTAALARRARGQYPVLVPLAGPFSLPVVLLGMDRWMEALTFGSPPALQPLLDLTSTLCVDLANAVLAAGADAIALAEPMASRPILPREQARRLVLPAVRRVVERVRGPVVFWSIGSIGHVADLLPDTGVVAVSTDPDDDLGRVKAEVRGRLAVLGGLNDLAMLTSSPEEVRVAVAGAIRAAAADGGFLLSNQHDIPFRVSPEVLLALGEAVRSLGRYDPSTGRTVAEEQG